MHGLLQKQLERYIDRLESAPEIPTRILVNMYRMDKGNRSDPSDEFLKWLTENILGDSIEEVKEWEETVLKWTTTAGILAGEENLFEIDPEINFEYNDEKLLRWLTNRAYNSAELIQGTTDEAVIMTLWDVAKRRKLYNSEVF